jgi:endonuclease YncB( thermonuclease family)
MQTLTALPSLSVLPAPVLALAAGILAWLALRLYLRRWRPMRLVTVIDGDTFMAVDMRGKRRKLRLLGVDCPELNQRNGPEARNFVQQACAKEVVQVRLKGRDRYKRDLADVQVGGKSLALLLVRAGLAYSLGGSLALRMAATGAWLSRRGVHKGFGQQKPWQSNSRGNGLVRWLSYRLRGKKPRR